MRWTQLLFQHLISFFLNITLYSRHHLRTSIILLILVTCSKLYVPCTHNQGSTNCRILQSSSDLWRQLPTIRLIQSWCCTHNADKMQPYSHWKFQSEMLVLMLVSTLISISSIFFIISTKYHHPEQRLTNSEYNRGPALLSLKSNQAWFLPLLSVPSACTALQFKPQYALSCPPKINATVRESVQVPM